MVREHLRHCPDCRAYFNELAAMDRALVDPDGEEGAPTGFEQRYTQAVMQAAIVTVDEKPAVGWAQRWQMALAWLRGSWAPVGALAAAAAVAAVFGAGLWGGQPSQLAGADTENTFTPRMGGGVNIDPIMERHGGVHQVEVFCAQRLDGRVKINDGAGGELRCGLHDELKFAFLNHSRGGDRPLPYLTLFGTDGEGRMMWYQPELPAEQGLASMKVGDAPRLRPFGETIRLEVNHRAGVVELFAVFSASPLRRADVEAHLQSLDDGTVTLKGMAFVDSAGQRISMGTSGPGEYVMARRTLHIHGGPSSPEGETP